MNAEDSEWIASEHEDGNAVDGTDMECHCAACASASCDYYYDHWRDSQ